MDVCRTRSADTSSVLRVRLGKPPWRTARLPPQQLCPCSRDPQHRHRRRHHGVCRTQCAMRRFMVLRGRSSTGSSRHPDSAKNCMACCLMLCFRGCWIEMSAGCNSAVWHLVRRARGTLDEQHGPIPSGKPSRGQRHSPTAAPNARTLVFAPKRQAIRSAPGTCSRCTSGFS